jgi:molybdopterin molybdotransferase
MMELFKVVSVDEAKCIIENNISINLGCEKINILNAAGRIIFEDIRSKCNIPEFRKSIVDGFAVNSKDVFGASETMPSLMELKGEILMGNTPPVDMKSVGECLYIPTGGMLPEGADSVVMIEYSEKLDENTILINSPIAPGDNVIQVGEDIKIDETAVKKGQRLRPYEIGLLAGIGIQEILVYKRPKVAVISTGDEIVPCDAEPNAGEVRDINTYLLYAALLEDGAEPISYGIIKDDYEQLKHTVDKALMECDIVLVSGGSSVGKKDQTLKVINSYKDGGILIHGMSVKPGKPTIVGKAVNKLIFGLPGHPLACSIIYRILVKNYMDKLQCKNVQSYGVSALMSINYHKAKGREEYLPVTLVNKNGKLTAEPVFGKSGLITAFSKAWGFIKIDRNKEGLTEGEEVYVYSF